MQILDSRVYVPAKDFAAAQRFYQALGFTLRPGFGGTVDCDLGAMRFRLQDYYVEAWASNLMFVLGTDDARGWYERVQAVIASGEHPGARVQEPEDVEGSLVTHVHDPSGVLLVLVENRSS